MSCRRLSLTPQWTIFARTLMPSPKRLRHFVPALRRAGWVAYDQHLKANQVESGVRSDGEVVILVLRTRFDGR